MIELMGGPLDGAKVHKSKIGGDGRMVAGIRQKNCNKQDLYRPFWDFTEFEPDVLVTYSTSGSRLKFVRMENQG